MRPSRDRRRRPAHSRAGTTGEGTRDGLDLARWQFGVITVYHFLFVPLTIGLSVLVAGMQTAWVRTGDER